MTAQGDYALFGLNAFSVGVGTIAMISNKISLHKTTDVVLSRFSSDKRKCIDDSDNYDIYMVGSSNYTLSFCLLDAAIIKTMAKECPHIDPTTLLSDLYGKDLYCAFRKVNARIGHEKVTTTVDGQEVECQVACQRQENDISVSTQGFPGKAFVHTREFWLVVYKLFWSCKNENNKYGFKRPGLDANYPSLCSFYDDYFYTKDDIKSKFEAFDDFGGSKEFLNWQIQELRFSKLEAKLGLTKEKQKEFIQSVMTYCRDNLARVVLFIQKPFVVSYLHDQVMSYLQLVANMGGLMGLCMGFSVVSVAEIFYHLALHPLLEMCTWKK